MSKCTYLGLQDDPNTALEFASDGNFCHHSLPAAPPNPAHQKAFCLTDEHRSCPVFLLNKISPLPKEIIFHNYKPNLIKKVFYRGSLLVVLLVFVAAALGGAFELKGFLSKPSAIPEGTSRGTSIQPPVVVVTGNSISPTSPSSLINPTSTLNSTHTGCTVPEGWVLYTVIPTDSIFRLSLIFGISVSELQAANCLGNDNVLRPGDQIYVPSLLTSTPTIDNNSPTPTDTQRPKRTLPPRPLPSYTFISPTQPKLTVPVPPSARPPPKDTPVPVPPSARP